MNGPHDLGGLDGFGPISIEHSEPLFHEEWEERAFGVTMAISFCGLWNFDSDRYWKECIPPALYLSLSYYQIWIVALEKILVDVGLVTEEELETGKAIEEPREIPNIVRSEDIDIVLATDITDVERETDSKAKFRVGDKVRSKNLQPFTHTRLPAYARDKIGTIVAIHGFHVLPDSNAHLKGENPEWNYAVEFSSVELFGTRGHEADSVSMNCWESYLEAT